MRFLEIEKSKYVAAENNCNPSVCCTFIQHVCQALIQASHCARTQPYSNQFRPFPYWWCAERWLTMNSLGEKKPCFVTLANSHCINTPPWLILSYRCDITEHEVGKSYEGTHRHAVFPGWLWAFTSPRALTPPDHLTLMGYLLLAEADN